MKTEENCLLDIDKQSWILCTFAVWFIVEIIFNTTIEGIGGISRENINSFANIIVLAMLMIQIVVLQTYKRCELFVIVAITILLLISALNSGYLSIVSTWMFIVATKNVKSERLILLAKRILQLSVPLVMLLCFLGLIENYTMYRGMELRQSLGFSHPNQLGLRIFQWVACYVYLTGGRNLKISEIVIFFISGLFTYLVPNSQSATVCLFLLIVCVLIMQMLKKKKRGRIFFGRLFVAGAIFVNLGSVFLSLIDLANYPVLSKLDKLLSIRFSAGHRVYELYGIKWLGHTVYVSQKEREVAGITEKLWLDNSYMTLLIRYGFFVYLLFTICFIFLLWKLYKSEEYKLLVILVTYSVYGIMENSVYMITHNIFIIVMGMLLYSTKKHIAERRVDNETGKNKKYCSRNIYRTCK